MKRIYSLTFFAIIAIIVVLSFLAVFSENARSEAFNSRVEAPRGLRLRESPDLNARVLVTIPNKSTVVVLEANDREITIDGIKGKWTRVGYASYSGWVFGGFLVEIEEELTLDDLIGGSFSFSIEEVEGADSTGFEILPGGRFTADCLLHGSGDVKIEGTYRAVVKKGAIQLIIRGVANAHHVAETEKRWSQKFTSGEVSITRSKGIYRGTFKLPICDTIINKKLNAQVAK